MCPSIQKNTFFGELYIYKHGPSESGTQNAHAYKDHTLGQLKYEKKGARTP